MDPGTATILSTIISTLGPQVIKSLFGGGSGSRQTGGIQGYDYNQDPQVQNIMKLWEKSPYNQEFNPEQANQQFNEQIADPSTKYYNERIRPGTESRFNNPNTTGGSALRKALNQGAEDLGGSLGSLRSNYLQNQQQNHAKGQYDLIAQQLGLSNNRANQFQPVIQGANGGFGGALGEGINKLDWSSILQNLFKPKEDGNIVGDYTPWDSNQQSYHPQQQPQQPQQSWQNNMVPWQVPGQLNSGAR